MDDRSRHMLISRLAQNQDFRLFLTELATMREQVRDQLATAPHDQLPALQGEHRILTRVLGWPRDAEEYLQALRTGPQDT